MLHKLSALHPALPGIENVWDTVTAWAQPRESSQTLLWLPRASFPDFNVEKVIVSVCYAYMILPVLLKPGGAAPGKNWSDKCVWKATQIR